MPIIYIKDAESTKFVSLDGNFRLCRRKKAGQRSTHEKPLGVNEIFANQSDVDRYVQLQSSSLVTVSLDTEKFRIKSGDL